MHAFARLSVSRRRGMVIWVLQCVVLGSGYPVNTCNRCATDVGFLRCTWIHRRAAPAMPAWSWEKV